MSENDLRLKKEKAKKMMLLFALLSITMTFGGLTSAYVVSKGRPDWLVDFTLPQSFIYSTFVIVLSSMTIQLSKFFLNKGKSKNRSLIFLATTFILGIIFLILQFNGFNNLIDLGYYFAGAQSNLIDEKECGEKLGNPFGPAQATTLELRIVAGEQFEWIKIEPITLLAPISPSIDLGDDGIIDWKWDGIFHHSTELYSLEIDGMPTSIVNSHGFKADYTNSLNFSILLPAPE